MGRVTVTLEKQKADFHFRSYNSAGHYVDIDDATAYKDGKGNGVGPMQLLVMAIGGCSGVDIVAILKKARQPLESFRIQVDGDKPDGVSPSIFEKIAVHFHFTGAMDEGKVRRAIDLSLGKYCSVARTLEKSATIEYDFTLNGTHHAGNPLI
jgi:putative redox protein